MIPAAPGKHRRSEAGPRPAPAQLPRGAAMPPGAIPPDAAIPLSAAVSLSAVRADAADRDGPPDPGGSAWPAARNSQLGLHPDHPSAPLPRIPPGPPGQRADPAAGPAASSQRWSAHPAGEVRITDSVWLAGRVMTVADDQAADVTYAAWGQAAAIRDAAEREAAAIRQQASEQAAAIREAAERDAAELRAAVLSMSGDLGRVAAYVTESLTVPARPATRPARPAASPVTLPAAEPRPDPQSRRQTGEARRQTRKTRRQTCKARRQAREADREGSGPAPAVFRDATEQARGGGHGPVRRHRRVHRDSAARIQFLCLPGGRDRLNPRQRPQGGSGPGPAGRTGDAPPCDGDPAQAEKASPSSSGCT